MELIQYLRDNSESVGPQEISSIIQILEDHSEGNFELICELIKVVPLSEELILPIQNALKHYANLSNYYIQQIQQSDVVVSIFTFGLQLGLQAGMTQKLRQLRQRAQNLILSVLSAETSIQFAQGLFAAFSLSQSLSTTQLSNFLNSEMFPSFLVPQVFNHLVNTQIQFAGQLLSQLQLEHLDYKQFLNNAESTQLRLIGIQHVTDQEILSRCYDGYYQIRAAFCQQLSKCKDIPNGQKIKLLFEKSLDKNVYVRRAAFSATQQVLLSNKLHVMDLRIIYMLQEKVNQLTSEQNHEQLKDKQDDEDSEDQTNLSEIKWDDYFEQCTYLNQMLQHANKRFLQMPQSEFTSFLSLVSECLRLKNDIAQNGFKDIVFQLPNTRINESQKQCLLNFLTEFLLSRDNERVEIEDEEEAEDIAVQNTFKQEIIQIIVQRLLDLFKTIRYKTIFNQIVKMLVVKVPRLSKYLFSNNLANTLAQLIKAKGEEEYTAIYVLESFVTIMGSRQIAIQHTSDLIVHIVKKLEQQEFNALTNSLGNVIYIILLKQLYDQGDNNLHKNIESYKQFIFNNIEPILLNPVIPITGAFKIILLQQKIHIDQLMGKLSRLNTSILQQIYYCIYCGEVIQHLQLNMDIQSSQEQVQDGKEGKSLNQIYTTLQQYQEDASSFLQEYSYLMYTIPILMRFLENPSIINNQSIVCMLVHTLTQFSMVLPKDLYLQNREFNDVAIELYQRIIATMKDNLIANKQEYINAAITIILNIETLVFYKPSEYHELMENCTNSFINIDDEIDSTLIMAISQLYNARCIKIQNYIRLLFGITERNDLAQVFFFELDQKIVKQFYRELQNMPGGDIKLLEIRMEEQQNQKNDKQMQEEQMAMMGIE